MRRLIDNRVTRWLKGFWEPIDGSQIGLTRRSVLGAGLAGIGTALLFGVHPQSARKSFNPSLVRPPGSRAEDEFLEKCIRCGECMKVCPTNAIQPTLFEAGLEGLWSPILKMQTGFCEYECNLCTQVCPTEAITKIGLEAKKKVHIGTAFFDKNRCLPYAFAKTCIVCEEHCPTPKKAIWFEEIEVTNERGEKVTVKQPRINMDLCIGCGICENKCVIRDKPAVYVTSAGESRNPENQILLNPW